MGWWPKPSLGLQQMPRLPQLLLLLLLLLRLPLLLLLVLPLFRSLFQDPASPSESGLAACFLCICVCAPAVVCGLPSCDGIQRRAGQQQREANPEMRIVGCCC